MKLGKSAGRRKPQNLEKWRAEFTKRARGRETSAATSSELHRERSEDCLFSKKELEGKGPWEKSFNDNVVAVYQAGATRDQ